MSVASGALAYIFFFSIVAHPFMTDFRVITFLEFSVWLAAFIYLVYAAAGKAPFFRFGKQSDCYFLCGGLIVIVSGLLVFLLHFPFEEELTLLKQSQAVVDQTRLGWLSEFMVLLVSLLGGGVGGNLAARAIDLAREGK